MSFIKDLLQGKKENKRFDEEYKAILERSRLANIKDEKVYQKNREESHRRGKEKLEELELIYSAKAMTILAVKMAEGVKDGIFTAEPPVSVDLHTAEPIERVYVKINESELQQ